MRLQKKSAAERIRLPFAAHSYFTARSGKASPTNELHGSTAPRLHGSTAPRLHGSTAPRLHGSTAPRLHGYSAETDSDVAQSHRGTTGTFSGFIAAYPAATHGHAGMTAGHAAITAAHLWAVAGYGRSFPRIPVKDRRVLLRHPISVQGAPDLATIQPILAPRSKATPSSSAGAGRASAPSSTCSKSR
jgi:hypothetical protein